MSLVSELCELLLESLLSLFFLLDVDVKSGVPAGLGLAVFVNSRLDQK
jgi:hypothetical protein